MQNEKSFMNALAQQFEQALLASDRIKSDELLGKALTQHSSSEVIEQLISIHKV